MIHYLLNDNLHDTKGLAESMFRDRANQFYHRLKWDVTVDEQGLEIDQYDALNPLYVIVSGDGENHQASMRLMPTIGRTMLNEHFTKAIGSRQIRSPKIWECTRLCISPGVTGNVLATLFVAGAQAMLSLAVTGVVGVFDRKMLPIYRRIGLAPQLIGNAGNNSYDVAAGIWKQGASACRKIEAKSEISAADAKQTFCAFNSIHGLSITATSVTSKNRWAA